MTVGVALSTIFAGVVTLEPAFGSLPVSVAFGAPGVAESGNSLFGTVILPLSPTSYSLSIPGKVILEPFAYGAVPFITVTSISPLSLAGVPKVTVGVALSTIFAGIFLSSLVSAGSFPVSVTVTFPVCTVSFS